MNSPGAEADGFQERAPHVPSGVRQGETHEGRPGQGIRAGRPGALSEEGEGGSA